MAENINIPPDGPLKGLLDNQHIMPATLQKNLQFNSDGSPYMDYYAMRSSGVDNIAIQGAQVFAKNYGVDIPLVMPSPEEHLERYRNAHAYYSRPEKVKVNTPGGRNNLINPNKGFIKTIVSDIQVS